MSDIPTESPSIVGRFFSDLFRMPGWQKWFLSMAAVLGGTGAVGQTYSKLSSPSTPPPQSMAQVQPSAEEAHPPKSSNFVSEQAVSPDSTPQAEPPEPTILQTHSPWMTRIGFSFVGGFILGWAFRAFIKTMAIVSFLGFALLMGLSYFHVVNVDFSQAREKYADSIAWISDQAAKARDVALTYFPSTGTSMAGLALGFRKK